MNTYSRILSTLFFVTVFSISTSLAVELSSHPKYAAIENETAVPLSMDHAYFNKARRTDFWTLIPFYVPQFNDYSCSVASVATALNGLMNATNTHLLDEDKNIVQSKLLDQIKTVPWKALTSPEGAQGRHGLTLNQLRDVINEALTLYPIKARATMVEFTAGDIKKWRSLLSENEKNPNDVMIIHFVQDDLTGAKGGPYAHISPIGAYDATQHRVLVLDVDRDYYSPYWVSDSRLLKAINHRTDMFGVGGAIIIEKIH